ncbi:MAG: hypothetical protein ABI882_11985 [Acidobacteriota bacterium]
MSGLTLINKVIPVVLVAILLATGSPFQNLARSLPGASRGEVSRLQSGAETQQLVLESWQELPIPRLHPRLFGLGPYLFLAGFSGEVYRSLDNGQTWENCTPGLPSGATAPTFAAIGESLFVGSSLGVFRSSDLGNNWVEVNSGLSFPNGLVNEVRGIATMAVIGTTLFAATNFVDRPNVKVKAGIFRSTDQGQNWTEVNAGLSDGIVQIGRLAVSGGNIFVGTNLGVFRSVDLGQTWTSLEFGSLLVAAADSAIFTTNSDGVWRSTNQGTSWTNIFKFSAGEFNSSLSELTARGNFVFVLATARFSPSASNTSFNYSADLGDNWHQGGPPKGSSGSPPFTYSYSNIYAAGENAYVTRSDGRLFASPGFGIPSVATVSAANYSAAAVAPESIAAGFGHNLAVSTESASTNPLPTVLGGTSVRVRDTFGTERSAPLLFVAPGQINYQIPAGTAPGVATIEITSSNSVVASGETLIKEVAPGLFSANSSGTGEAAAFIVRVKPDDTQFREWAVVFDTAQNKYVTSPIDMGPTTDRVYLILFGTGIRHLVDSTNLKVKIGGYEGLVSYYGPQGDFVGLDQLNILMPRSLIGSGEVVVELIVNGFGANKISVNVK